MSIAFVKEAIGEHSMAATPEEGSTWLWKCCMRRDLLTHLSIQAHSTARENEDPWLTILIREDELSEEEVGVLFQKWK